MAGAHVPPETDFSTKPQLAIQMIKRALNAQVPFAWVAADTVYGVGSIETALRRAGKGYVLGVKSNHTLNSWMKRPAVAGTAEQIANDLQPTDRQRLSAGEGSQGARLHDWAYFELADLDACDYDREDDTLWTCGLLIRRWLVDGELAFFSTWAPAGTSIETLAWVEGHRWSIENAFETAKNELGFDHNEMRSWHGWYRHVSLVMLAFSLMAVVRHQANAVIPPKTVMHLASLIQMN